MRILLAEDSTVTRLAVEGVLSTAGHEVVAVEDGEAAWEVFRRQDAPKLAVLDWVMPKMEGPEVIRRVRAALRAEAPYIILLTSRDGKEDVVQGLEAGADDYLTKPFDAGELRARVQAGARIIQLQAMLSARILEAQKALVARQKAEEALCVSEERYRLFFSEMRVGFALIEVVYDGNGNSIDYRHLEVNAAFEKYTGLCREAVVGKMIREALPGIEPFWIETYGKVVSTGESVHFEKYAQPLHKWFEVTAFRLRHDQVGVAFADITERKLAERELQRSEAYLTAAQKLTHTGSWAWNLGSQELFWSQETFRIFGFDPAQVKASLRGTFLPRVHPEDRPRIEEGLNAATVPRTETAANYRIVLPDGSVRYLHEVVFPVTNGSGEIVERFGVVSDVTERRQTEAENQRLAAAVEQAAETIVITDRNGAIQYVNPAFTRTTGYSRAEALGQNPRVLKSGHHDTAFYATLWQTICDGRTWQGDVVNRRKDGTLYVENAVITPVLDQIGEISNFIALKQDVTERRRAEEASRESEERFRLMFERSLSGMVRVTPDGIILDANHAMARMVGYDSRQEMIGKKTTLFTWEPGQREGMVEQLRQKGSVQGLELRLRRKDGEDTWALVSITLITPRGGAPFHQAELIDITERKRAEEALSRERNLLRTLVDNLTDWVFVKDLESRFVVTNSPFAQALGIENPEELVGKTDTDFLAPELAKRYVADDKMVISSGEPLIGREEPFAKPDGSQRWLWTTKVPLRDSGGSIVGLVSVCRDITERKRTEEAMRQSEEKYRSLVANIPDVAWTVSAAGQFTFISPKIEALSGYTRNDIRERGLRLFFESIHPDDIHKVRGAFEALFAKGEPYDVEFRVRRKDGEWIWARDRAVATYERDGVQYADGLLTNVTKHKKMGEALRLTQFAVDRAADAVFWVDPQGHIVYVNEAACRSLERSREELLSLSIPDIDPDFPPDGWGPTWQKTKALGSMTFESQHQTRQGRLFPVEVTSNYVEFGGKEYAFSFVRDISKRKRAEEALVEAAKLAALRAEVGVALTHGGTLRSGLQECAQALVRRTGAAFARIWTLDDSAAMLILEASAGMYTHLNGPHGRVPVGKFKIGRIAQSGEPHLSNDVQNDSWVGDREWARREGMVSFAGHPLTVENQVVGVLAVFAKRVLAEATLRAFGSVASQIARFIQGKRSEEALQRNEAYLAESQRLSHIGSWVWSASTREIAFWSPEHYRIFGFEPGKGVVSFQTAAERIHPEDRPLFDRIVDVSMRDKRDFESDQRVVLPDGSVKYTHSIGHPVLNAAGDLVEFVGTCMDVTERKRAEARLTVQYRTARALADSDTLAEATPRILEGICETLGWEGGTLWEADSKAKVLRPVECWHVPSLELAELEAIERQTTFSRGSGLAGRVWATSQPLWVPDMALLQASDKIPVASKYGLHATLTLPIIVGREVLSVMQLFSRRVVPQDKEALEMLMSIGGQIGPLIERQRAEDERGRAEAALAGERNLLRTLIDNLPVYVFVKDAQGRIVINNTAHQRLLGASCQDDVTGKTDFDFFVPELARKYQADEQAVILSGRPLLNSEEPTVDTAAKALWLSTSKVPWLDQVGNARGIVGISHDITKLKQAQDALQQSEERAKLLFATIPHPAYVFDLDTLDFLEVNRAAVENYGYSREEFLRMKVTDIRPRDETGRLAAYLEHVGTLTTPSMDAGQRRHRTKDGRIIDVEITFHHLEYDGHRAELAIAQDITERKRLEIELRHSQKLEAVGGLAAGIAHEINTPIQFVGDNTHFLQDSFADLAKLLEKYRQVREAAGKGSVPPALVEEVIQAEATADLDYLLEEIPKALTQSMDGVTRVATIVRAMKEFAHPDRSEKMATDLNKALESTLLVGRNEIKYVAEVETDLGDLPLTLCHGGDMNQVFLNLLVNAAHAIKDRNKGEGNSKKGLIRVETRQEGTEVVISISDTGCGIPENIREKIFEPFFTTKEVGRGTGQGLAIARNIVVEKHGGSLTFETELGRGTTFYIRLPVSLKVEPEEELA